MLAREGIMHGTKKSDRRNTDYPARVCSLRLSKEARIGLTLIRQATGLTADQLLRRALLKLKEDPDFRRLIRAKRGLDKAREEVLRTETKATEEAPASADSKGAGVTP